MDQGRAWLRALEERARCDEKFSHPPHPSQFLSSAGASCLPRHAKSSDFSAHWRRDDEAGMKACAPRAQIWAESDRRSSKGSRQMVRRMRLHFWRVLCSCMRMTRTNRKEYRHIFMRWNRKRFLDARDHKLAGQHFSEVLGVRNVSAFFIKLCWAAAPAGSSFCGRKENNLEQSH